jgi:hypothetical protein
MTLGIFIVMIAKDVLPCMDGSRVYGSDLHRSRHLIGCVHPRSAEARCGLFVGLTLMRTIEFIKTPFVKKKVWRA